MRQLGSARRDGVGLLGSCMPPSALGPACRTASVAVLTHSQSLCLEASVSVRCRRGSLGTWVVYHCEVLTAASDCAPAAVFFLACGRADRALLPLSSSGSSSFLS